MTQLNFLSLNFFFKSKKKPVLYKYHRSNGLLAGLQFRIPKRIKLLKLLHSKPRIFNVSPDTNFLQTGVRRRLLPCFFNGIPKRSKLA